MFSLFLKRMKLFIFSILCVFLIFSCSKDQKTINRLEGTWELVTYYQQSQEGLKTFIESSGEIIFTPYRLKKTTESTYIRSQNYSVNGIPQIINESGNYSIDEKGKRLLIRIKNPDGSYSTDIKIEVNTITSTDLKIVGYINYISQTFIYKKKK